MSTNMTNQTNHETVIVQYDAPTHTPTPTPTPTQERAHSLLQTRAVHERRDCMEGLRICVILSNWILGMSLIVGLGTFLTGCNSTLYPMGCPLYTATLGTVANTTILANCDRSSCRFNALIDWTVCTEQVEGRQENTREWAQFMLDAYPTGHRERVWLPKPGLGVLNGCFSEGTFKRVSSELPIVGILFFVLTGILCMCMCTMLNIRRKLEQEDRRVGI